MLGAGLFVYVRVCYVWLGRKTHYTACKSMCATQMRANAVQVRPSCGRPTYIYIYIYRYYIMHTHVADTPAPAPAPAHRTSHFHFAALSSQQNAFNFWHAARDIRALGARRYSNNAKFN